jgi:hypothetical protein
MLGRHVGSSFEFELQTNFFQGMMHHFKAMFVDLTPTSKVLCTNSAEEFDKYPRANALKSLLLDKCFPSVEAFSVACRNALGDNIQAFDLAGNIFVNDQCVDEAIDALDAKATEEKMLTEKLATQVEAMKYLLVRRHADIEKIKQQLDILKEIVTHLCCQTGRQAS